ncbi:MAG: HYR domain-containing protein [Saprospirales bacterium]|nr:HYR domain-containing protein [Saprospirales bacterium]
MSAFSRFLTLVCFAVLGHTAAFAQGGCPGGSCTITCPADISLCLAPDNYGHSAITVDWVASHTSSPNPDCDVTRVWRDAMGMVELTDPIWVDCDDEGDHVDLWVSREKYLWPECRSSLVKVRIHIKDCEPPAVICPPMRMYVCNDDVPRPGVNLPFPLNLVWPGYKLINQATFQALGGSASDACGLDGVVYKDDIIATDPFCKTNRTIRRTFVVFDINGNHKTCQQDIVVADNVPPVFTHDPADLSIECDRTPAAMAAAINNWLNVNRDPGNNPGQDAVVVDGCDENMVMITAVPGTAATILAQMPNACDPNPREVIVVFTADDGCANQATRSARVRLIDIEKPDVPPIANSYYDCADQVPPAPNFDVVVGETDNCTPTDKLKIELIGSQINDQTCPDRFTLIRTYRITDCDGNYRDRTHTIYVDDDVNPYWNPAPQAKFMMDVCDPLALLAEIQAWLDDHGGGIALDGCGTPDVGYNKTAAQIRAELLDFCTPPTSATSSVVTFTATDACGNTRTATATIRLMDTQAPNGTPPAAQMYDCADDVPQMLASQVIFLNDNCTDGSTVQVTIEANPPAAPGCVNNPHVMIRKWRLTDCAGNTRIVSQMIQVKDRTAPQWTNVPDDFSRNCTAGSLNTELNDWLTNIGGSSAALDQCSGSNLTYSYSPASVQGVLDALRPCGPKAGTTTVTFYAKDECGNSVSATATVNIFDNTPPTATPVESMYSCPDQVPPPNPNVITDEYDSCSPNPPSVMFLPGATQNNGGSGCMGDPLIIIRWYKLTDCSANTASVSHQITVVDMTAPQALCQALTRNLDANGVVTVNATEFNDGSFDNCGIKKIEIRRGASGPWFSQLTFDCADIPDIPNCGAFVENSAIITIQMRVTDNCDQTDICTTTITVIDNEPPTIECPDDMTVYTDNNGGYDCKADATWTHPSPHDNCSVKCMTMEVQKEINGVFTTINPANGFPTPNYQVNVIADAGDPYTLLVGKGPYCDDNEYKIIYRVRDEHGNTKPEVMCMFKILVKDNEAPLWNDCPDAPIVAQTVTGDCYQMKCWTRPTAYDNCEYPSGPCPAPTVVVTVSDPTVMINQVGDEDCALFPVGRTVVTYTATDAEGNVSTCTVEVLISDDQDPVAMCAGPFTVNMEPDGDMQLSVADIDAPGTWDNCGICFKGVSRNPNCCFGPTVTLTCADVGTVVRVYMRVGDCSRPDPNTATCYSDITVEDMQLPGNAYCPADIEKGTDPGVCTAVVAYIPPTFNDGCNSPKAGTLVAPLWAVPGATFPIGNTTVTYSYTSPSGYTVYCSFVVTVVDDEAPSITCPADVLNLTCLEILPEPLALDEFTDGGGQLSDNCGVTVLDFTDYDNDLTHCAYDGIRTIVRTYTAWDAAGNSATCQQTFQYVEDITPPVLAVKPGDLSFECADDIPPVPAQSATDNCGDVVIDFSEEVQPNGCENKLVVIRYWVASDACGNTATWRQTITVNDIIPPELYAKPLRRHYACAEDVEIAPYQFATDNCDVAYVEFSETEDPGECHNKFTIERRWVAYDLCGNSSTWEQQIIVNDSIPPVLSATPVDREYTCFADVEAAPVQVATDNCGVVTLNFEETENPNDCHNKTTIIRRWYAYDLCGNTAEHWQTITVYDYIPPVLQTRPVDRTYECADQIPVAPVQTATDNCDVVTIDFAETTVPGDCPNQYQVVRRWYAYDLCGNTDEHWQTITISDTKAPVFNETLPPAVVNDDCAQDVPAAAVLTATDNCDGAVTVVYTEEVKPGTCQDQFSIVRIWTAEDLCGNVVTHKQVVNIYDGIAPTWNEPPPDNPVVECSQLVPAVPVQTASDNCGVAVTIDFSEVEVPGTCSNQYSVVRTWVAQDACGNVTTRVQVVTVSDTEAPVWNEPAPATPLAYECSEQVPPVPVQTATDNCGEPLDLEYYEVWDPSSCPNSFVLTRVWTAQDDCGNATTRIQVITVSDILAPVWDQPAPDSPVNVACSEGVPPVPTQTATDNCGVPVDINFNEVIDWGTCANQFSVIRTWTAADDCGNITTRIQVINVNDVTAPVMSGLPTQSVVNVECSEQVPAVPVVTATDNCILPVFLDFSEVEIPGTCPNQYSIKRTWFAQDDCGNSTIFVQTINISDVIAPVLSGLPTQATVNVECSEQVPAVPVVTATDNCIKPIEVDFSEVEIPGTCPNQYSIKRTWFAQDDCGNSTIFVQTINISDVIAPVLSGLPTQATVNVECSEQVPAVPVVTATDNCIKPIEVDFSGS